MTIPDFDCGLEGEDKDSVLVGRFNRWIAHALRVHVVPLKAEVKLMREEITIHIHEDHIMQAKILGGLKVLQWMLPILAILVPGLLIFILYVLNRGGVIVP